MEKIKCICQMADDDFSNAIKGMLLYSGYFNLMEVSEEELQEAFGDPRFLIILDRYKLKKQPKAYVVELFEEIEEGRDFVIGKRYNGKVISLYKYAPFSELLSELGYIIGLSKSNRVSNDLVNNSLLKRICVVGASGGVGSTTITDALSKVLYRNGKKPLCVDLSPVAFYEGFSKTESSDSITRLLYKIKRGSDFDITHFTYDMDGPSWIRRPMINKYHEEMDLSVVEAIEENCISTGIDVLILDIGSHFTENNLRIIESSYCSIFIFPLDDNWLNEDMKIAHSIMELGPAKRYGILNDVRGFFRNEKVDAMKIDEDIDLIIPHYGMLNERSVDGAFGNDIRFIVDRIFEGETWLKLMT